MMKKIALLLSIVFVLEAGTLLAQERSKDFYDKNFAESPLKRRDSGPFPDGSFPNQQQERPSAAELEEMLPPGMNKADLERMLKSGAGEWQKEMGIVPATPTPRKREDVSAGDLTGLERAIPVRAIGAIINSIDAKHYEESMKQLTDLVIAKDLDIGTIYAMGDMKVASDSPYVARVMARGGVVHFVSNIPKGYDVSLSPTWIIKTDEGEALLEAVGNFEKYFNQRGQYLDREQRAPAEAKPSAAPVS